MFLNGYISFAYERNQKISESLYVSYESLLKHGNDVWNPDKAT